jgi:MFS family permease
MERFGVRAVTRVALGLIAAGSGLSVRVTGSWQLVLLWGVLIGLGTGSMALVFAAIVANRWFVRRRELVMGVLTAASATGQLVFLPVLAWMSERSGWRSASLVVAAAALAVIPLVLLRLPNGPADLGVAPYGAPADPRVDSPRDRHLAVGYPPGSGACIQDGRGARTRDGGTGPAGAGHPAEAARTRTFWALAVGFAICGASTSGLVATHFIPSAHGHGMPETTAAGLLAVVGIFAMPSRSSSASPSTRQRPLRVASMADVIRGYGLAS